MDKLRMLQDLEECTQRPGLTDDALRLYLLLLAACSDDGEGKLSLATVKEALGRDRFRVRLALGCARLKEAGLLVMADVGPLSDTSRGPALHYRLRVSP